jgi:hypothetical protein
MARRGRSRRSRRSRRRTSRARTSRRRNTRTAQSRRAANRAAARSRAQAAARKRVAARKAAGRKPSGANRAANRAAARARAQAAARKRIAQKRTIAQTKARNEQRMREAAAERNRKFKAERAAAAKRKSDAAAAKRRSDAAAAKRRAEQAAAVRRKAQEAAKVEKPTGNPNVMSADGTFNRPGPGGPEPESDYTSYKPGSFYNLSDTNLNMTNALRSTRNLITAPARALGINNRLTNRLIPKSNEAIQDARDQRGPRPTLTRRRSGGGGGASRIAQQVAAQAIQPEIAPTIGQPIEETGAAPTVTGGGAEDLTRIQNQAYNTQLTSSLAGMFGGQGSVGYIPQGDQALSPTLRAGRSRGRRRVRLFGARRRRGGTGDQFSRAGDRIAKLTNLNI